MEVRQIVERMTLKDKISLCTGADFWHSKAMEEYGIPAFTMADGPHGLRFQNEGTDMLGINRSLPATCFPAAVTAGAAWDPDLCAAEARAIGEEALARGVDVVLGPGCNIKRDPLCGRNFEYFSEDPHLTGRLATAYVKGLQSTGVSACVKHFAANSQEYKRQNGDSQVDDRALREIYLAAFESAVREGKPGALMCAYNKINGVHASDHRWLLTQVLREEWGFEGAVITDWSGLNDRIQAFRAGCDLNMPGGSRYMERATLEAVREGRLDEGDINAAVERILRLALRSVQLPKGGGAFDREGHDALAYSVALKGAVLLKNEGGILPVCSGDMVLIGSMARTFRYQGTGSSHIVPTRLVSLTDALPQVPFVPCCDSRGRVTEEELDRAAQAAREARVAVVVAGLPEDRESEGLDRRNMKMPKGHIRMIQAVAQANPNTVVVLLGGSPMELPWCDQVKAILYMGLPGQAGGRACADLLTGRHSPAGKLTETWPVSYSDGVTGETFGKKWVEYRESIYVGYRYYDKANKEVRFPFGHGLSYTEFRYSDLRIEGRRVTAALTNVGKVPAAEVVQLYLAPPKGGLHRPEKELKGFARLELSPGERGEVSFLLDDRSFAVWQEGWRVPGGTYQVLVGASSRDIRLRGSIEVEGEDLPAPQWQAGSWYETMEDLPTREEWEKAMGRSVPLPTEREKGEFTLDNTCLEMREDSLVMKLQYRLTGYVIARSFGGRAARDDPAFRMMLTCATDCPLRSMVISTGGAISEEAAHGLVELANGHYLGGLRALWKGRPSLGAGRRRPDQKG